MSYNKGMRKHYSAAFKAKVVQELLKEEKSLAQLAAEYGVSAKQLNRWKTIALEGLLSLFEPTADQTRQEHEQQVNELYAEIGRLTTQLTWLKKKSGFNLEPH
jgi:transposase-like protein